jgi:hypothetical protein
MTPASVSASLASGYCKGKGAMEISGDHGFAVGDGIMQAKPAKPRKTSTEAFKRWRERNRDKWRTYHTNYMRKYRAAKKATA